MTIWLPDREHLTRPVYLSLAQQIARAIESGDLKPGQRLPTHRALADQLHISVQTVSRAYDELIRKGLVAGQVGRGTYVCEVMGEPEPPFIRERPDELIDLSMLRPVAGDIHRERMQTALIDLAPRIAGRLLHSFRPDVVLRPHKQAAVDWLKRCGVQARADNIQIVNGATPAMTLAIMTALRPGETLATEVIGHHTLVALARYLGVNLVGLPIDNEGVLPDGFEASCREHRVKALFLVPSVANPTVSVMGLARRLEIIDIARKHDVAIIENEAWGPLVKDTPPAFAALSPERAYYLTSFTKCVAPALRIGYLVSPEHVVASAANRHLVTNWIATPIMSALASQWVSDGTAWELVRWQRRALRARFEMAHECLRGVDFRSHPESLHIWLKLPASWREEEFVAHCRLRGVAVAPGASFVTTPAHTAGGIRVCIGAGEAREIRRGLEIIASILSGAPEPALLTI